MRTRILTVLLLPGVLAGCGNEGSTPSDAPKAAGSAPSSPVGTPPATTASPSSGSGLTATLADGTTLAVTPTKVTCGPGAYGHGVTVVQVHAFSRDYNFLVEVVPKDVAGGKTFEMPVDAGDDQDGPRNAMVFFATKPNIETSTVQEESAGTLRVDRATCDPAALDLSIDATLDSEYFDGESVDLQGHLVLAE